MERGSDRHGPKLDEQIKKEVEPLERATHQESHVEEDREKEDRPDHTLSAQEEGRPEDAGLATTFFRVCARIPSNFATRTRPR